MLKFFFLSVFVFMFSFSANAQEKYGDWTLLCVENKSKCGIYQRISMNDKKGKVIGKLVDVTIEKVSKSFQIGVRAPLNSDLRKGLFLGIDGADPFRLAYVRCQKDGCLALATLDEKWITNLSRGNKLNVIIPIFQNKKTLKVDISLKGFTKAIKRVIPNQ